MDTKDQSQKREENIEYKPMGKPLTRAEIEAKEGQYDEDGFYNLPDKSFYDPAGYYFNKDGYDEFGGYYDDQSGSYVPGAGYEDQYYRNYQGVRGDMFGYTLEEGDDDYDNEEDHDYNLEEGGDKEATLNHIMQGEDWLKEQDEGKEHIIKLENIPELFNENNIKKFLNKRIQELNIT